MKQGKALFLTALITAMLLGILITVARTRPDSLAVMAAVFSALGVVYFVWLLYRFIAS